MGEISENLIISSKEIPEVTVKLYGTEILNKTTYKTINRAELVKPAENQKVYETHTLAPNTNGISQVKEMFVKLECNAGDCPDWDVYGKC